MIYTWARGEWRGDPGFPVAPEMSSAATDFWFSLNEQRTKQATVTRDRGAVEGRKGTGERHAGPTWPLIPRHVP